MTQLGLFDRADAPRARRTWLDDRSWVEHVPGWLAQHGALFAQLLVAPAWAQRDRWMYTREVREPRMTAEYPAIADAPHGLAQIADALSRQYGVRYDGLWLNLYRDHRDSTAWHGDWPSCRRAECVVPVLSLGARRRFLVRARAGGRSLAWTPEGGDLIVMGGRCQRDWVHCVPKQSAPAGARISVNFQSSEQGKPDP